MKTPPNTLPTVFCLLVGVGCEASGIGAKNLRLPDVADLPGACLTCVKVNAGFRAYLTGQILFPEVLMLALTLMIHIFLGSTIAGSFIVVALVAGLDTAQPIILAGLAGFVLSFPASWLIARAITRVRQ